MQKVLRALVGPAIADGSRSRLSASGRIARNGKRYRLALEIQYGAAKGTRVMEANLCSDLSGAAAVALGLLVRTERSTDAPLSDEDLVGLSGAPPTTRTEAGSSSGSTSAKQLPGTPTPASTNTGARTASTNTGARSASTNTGARTASTNTGARTASTNTGTRTASTNTGARTASTSTNAPKSAPTTASPNALTAPHSPKQESHEREVQSSLPPGRSHRYLQAPRLAVDVLTLPKPSYGIGLGAGWAHAGWRLLGVASAWLPQTVNAMGLANVQGRFLRLNAEAYGCRAWALGQLEVGPCLTVSIDGLNARARGAHVVSPASSYALWISPGAALLGWWNLDPSWSVMLGLQARVATSRPRFTIDKLGEVTQVAPASVAIILGWEWIL